MTDSFESQFVDAHNDYRQKHGAPPLTLSRDLCISAQKWADHLLSSKCLEHSSTDHGENLYYAYSSVPKEYNGKDAVDNWYSEIKDYHFDKPGFTSGTGHFTQVVWKDSREVGVGIATDGKTIFVVGQYHPAGNISNAGYFEKNVLPPGSSPSDRSSSPVRKPDPSQKGTTHPEGKGSDRDFESQFVDAHNDYRQKHGAPPLMLSKDLCNSAQKWADHLLSSKCLKHSSTDHGENIYYASSSVPKEYNGKDAVDKWYSEIKDYHFDKSGFTPGTGHFTQVVWKDSKEVGVGIATDGKTIFVVGQYHPAGNISNAGYFEKNVLPPGSSPSDRPSSPVRKPDPSQKGTTHPEGKGSDHDFKSQFVDAHNDYRQKHGAPPLTLSKDLCNSAQKWADHLLSSKCLEHSSTDHGENIYYASSSVPKEYNGKDAVDKWYSEIKDYHFDKPGFVPGTGHFTQVVWKDSREVGVGIATDGKTIIVVGQYHPAGNISNAGYFEKNVLPPGNSTSDRSSSPVRKPDPSQKGTTHPEGKGSDRDFESQFVDAHNDYRQKHGAPPLTLSKDLCNSAQKWADHLLSSKCLKHSSTDHGENLYYASSSVPKEYNGKDAVDKWYSEIKDYHFDKSGFTPGTGHFTQVVWKDSREVGVGIATDGKTIFVVGQYHPAGNISNAGYFEKNVLPPGSSTSDRHSSPVRKPDPSQKGTTHPEGKGSDRDFESQFVDAHNDYRQKHGAPPLTLSKDLCNSAQKWADHLLSSKCLEHSSTDHGENLYYASSSVPKEYNGKDAVDKWYSEIKDYHFDKSGFTPGTGHFTQVVWKDSREVGVGIATDGKTIIVVGQYHPAGNISNAGYFEKNVLPPGSSPSDRPSSPVRKRDPSQKGTTHPEGKGSDRDFESQFVDAHNDYRQKHGAPPLTLSKDLCNSAQKWADHLLSSKCLKHSSTDHGENLYYASSSVPKEYNGKDAVDKWYSEIKDYHFDKSGFTPGTGHFTQVVWKDSREVGVGIATDGKTIIVVGQYHPAGNISNAGYFEKNVLPPGSSPSDRPSSPVGKRDPSQKGTTHPEGKGSDRDFESQFVDAHNDYRQKHGAPPLTLSKDLCNSAQKWADHLLSLKCLEHSSTDHGENLYYASSSVPKEYNGKDAVDKWYSEIKDYHFDKSGFTPGTGHFTQVVWKDSREVGVGIATDGKTIIVVGQYNPAGNISNAGYFEKNVLPPGSSPSDRPSSPVRKPDPSQKGTTHPEGKGSASELDTFVRDLLTSLNQYRSQHGAGRLELSSALTREAQEWADHLISINRLMNSNRGHGENILCLSGSSKTAPTGSHVAESWYKEIENYDFSSPGFKNGAGNFTQMVWKSSKQVGLGLATNGLGKFIAVAFFDPAGNINNTGYFHDNVKTKGSRM